MKKMKKKRMVEKVEAIVLFLYSNQSAWIEKEKLMVEKFMNE